MNVEISDVTRPFGRVPALAGELIAGAAVPVGHRTPRAARAVPLNAARLLRVELRHNTMPWILPLIAALFWFDSYRPSLGTSPLYELRTYWNMGQGHTILDFGPFVAGVAAWMGSRDRRRGLADLVTATVRPRWSADLVTWAATAIWAVAAYLVFVGVMFAAYAHAFVGAGNGSGSPVQQAVQAALLRGAGIPFAAQPGLITTIENFPGAGPASTPGPATGSVYAAARRLATLPAAARNAWLATHLAVLRAGGLTVNDLP